ncbi:MAG: TonB-dependent receptor [Melioribacteraceae bacterium]|nr:TonB-dependent receptor [Melioribacteraceae bacterium]
MRRVLLILLMLSGITTFSQQTKQDTIKSYELKAVTIIDDKAKSIPGSGQFINNKKLEKLNQSNINNVLRIIPGVNIRDEEGFGLRPNIGLRGTPVNRSAKVTLMEDGILIAPAPYADPSAYYFPTFVRMQSIEVLKGSSQIKYGPYTIGGAVNLLSTSIPELFKGFAQTSYGSFNTNQQRVWVGDSRQNLDYVFEINRIASSGFKELDNGGNTGFNRHDVMAKLRWHSDDDADIPQALTLKFLNSSEDGNETYLGLTYEDYISNPFRRYSATQKDLLEMKHQHLFLNYLVTPVSGLMVNTTVYYATTYRDWARANTIGGQSINNILNNPAIHQTPYQIMIGIANGNIDYQSAARTYFSKGIQTNIQRLFNTSEVWHKIILGLRYHEDQSDRYATRSVYSMDNGNMILNSVGVKGNQENQIRNAGSFSSYLNYEINYKGLKVSPGLRYEKINFDFQNYGNTDVERIGISLKTASNDFSVLLPGLGINYEIDNTMNLFGGIHKGFSPPGMPSLTSTTGQAKVETSLNYELGYSYENNLLNAQVTAFYNNYDNILGSDNVSGGGAGTGEMFNAGNAKIQGLEVSFASDLLNINDAPRELKLPVSLTYTYTSAKFNETFINGGGDWGTGKINKGDFIPFITPHLLTASIGFEHNKFNATVIGRFTGETRVKPGQGNILVPAGNINYSDVNALKGYLIVDISANFMLNRTFTVFTAINNLTNSKAIVANLPQGFRPNMPLSFNVGLKADF